MKRDAIFYKEKYVMEPHEEGGFFSEVYRSALTVYSQYIDDVRPSMTSIYFLLTSGEHAFSSFHKIKSDELWCHHDGGDIAIYIIGDQGKLEKKILGKYHHNAELQVVVPRECWFAAEILDDSEFALAGCIVSPGFIYADWTLAERKHLQKQFPSLEKVINRLTRD